MKQTARELELLQELDELLTANEQSCHEGIAQAKEDLMFESISDYNH